MAGNCPWNGSGGDVAGSSTLRYAFEAGWIRREVDIAVPRGLVDQVATPWSGLDEPGPGADREFGTLVR